MVKKGNAAIPQIKIVGLLFQWSMPPRKITMCSGGVFRPLLSRKELKLKKVKVSHPHPLP